MKAYELVLILIPGLDDEARGAALEKVRALITEQKGAVDSEDSWGTRKLAYEVKGQTEGDYVVLQFHADSESIAELDRVLHITDQVIRYMIVRRDDLD